MSRYGLTSPVTAPPVPLWTHIPGDGGGRRAGAAQLVVPQQLFLGVTDGRLAPRPLLLLLLLQPAAQRRVLGPQQLQLFGQLGRRLGSCRRAAAGRTFRCRQHLVLGTDRETPS